MHPLKPLSLILAFFLSASFASAQIEPEDQDDICDAELSTDGFVGSHCYLFEVDSSTTITTQDGNCDLERDCAITAGTVVINYVGPPDPNIDVISNEGLIPTVVGGDSYVFDPTGLHDVPCHSETEITFSMLYYASGIPYVICEWRHLFECHYCANEV